VHFVSGFVWNLRSKFEPTHVGCYGCYSVIWDKSNVMAGETWQLARGNGSAGFRPDARAPIFGTRRVGDRCSAIKSFPRKLHQPRKLSGLDLSGKICWRVLASG
jgi:hypothetical protein